jgi:hypothetical protein
MGNSTQASIATTFTTGEALPVGVSIVGVKADGLLYLADDVTDILRVVGTANEAAAISTQVAVFPGIDEFGTGCTISCKNSTKAPLAQIDVGTICYIESYADAGDDYGTDWTVAKTSSHSVIAGVFRGFAGSSNGPSIAGVNRVAVQVGKQSA